MHAAYPLVLLVPVLAAAIVVPCASGDRREADPARPTNIAPADAPVMPTYDARRALILPERYREWVFVGASLGLSYDPAPPDHEMFHETLMEPTAYRHFVETGEFRDGSMFVLLLHGVERAVLPGRRGQFAGDVHGVEMAVKDRTRTPEGWAYYGFGGMGGTAARTAQPEAPGACYGCHRQHAARDNVFLQFYPLLARAARVEVPIRRAPDPARP
jgi:hypothetical protein